MDYEAAQNASINTNESPAVIAARYGISERSVYRYRSGLKTREKLWYLEPALAAVKAHTGDKEAIHKALEAAGLDYHRRTYARMVLLKQKRVTADEWPAVKYIASKYWDLLHAMIKAGATPAQIARCFMVGDGRVQTEIREAIERMARERRVK